MYIWNTSRLTICKKIVFLFLKQLYVPYCIQNENIKNVKENGKYLDWLCMRGVLSPQAKLLAREGEGTLAAQLL